MKIVRVIFIFLAAFLALAGGLWAFKSASLDVGESSCEEHLMRLVKADIATRRTHPSMKALRQQWTNSVPVLIRAIEKRDSWGQRFYRMAYTNAPAFISSKMSPPKFGELMEKRMISIQALAVIGPRAKAAIPVLMSCLGDGLFTHAAQDALTEIGPRAEDVPALIGLASRSQDSTARGVAAFLLAQTARTLWKIAGETNMVFSIGKVLLGHAKPETVVNNLIGKVSVDPAKQEAGVNAAKVMAEVCLKEKWVEPLEDEMLDHGELAIRVYGASALWKLKGFDERIVPILIDGLQDYSTLGHHRRLRELCARTLGEIGPRAKAAIPVLEEALIDGAPQVEAAVKVALEKVGE